MTGAGSAMSLTLLGVNLSGAEFASDKQPGRLGTDYTYPTPQEIDYYSDKGINVIRLPFLWERLQPSQYGALQPDEMAQITSVVDYAQTKNIKVVLDPHNYGYGYGNMIGSKGTPNSSFADFWGKVASRFAGSNNVIFGLMNEPHDQSATQWLGSVNAATAAIRNSGATSQEILVPGTYWDGAHSWVGSGNDTVLAPGVNDPAHNFAFEVHQYLDIDSSGSHPSAVSASIGVDRLQSITQWAENTHSRLFLGEVGVARDSTSLTALDNMLGYMAAHPVWQGATYWSGGPWWGDYMFSIEPKGLGTNQIIDQPQMNILSSYTSKYTQSVPNPIDVPPVSNVGESTSTIPNSNSSVGHLPSSNKPTQAADPKKPVPCYMSGTRIRALIRGEVTDVPIETLRIGDQAISAAGVPRTIRWIGTRTYHGLTAPQHDRPVRIKADALADGMPGRDLLVSPDHALWLDGLFVAAGHLVNGSSITRGEQILDLTYWHIELDKHDLLLAENTAAESFLPTSNVRMGLDGDQIPDTDGALLSYAQRAEFGPDLAALRGRLARRGALMANAAIGGPVLAWLDQCVYSLDGAIHVGGWALNAAQPDLPMCLDILVDGQVAAFTVAAEYRADVAAAGIGSGYHGFDLGFSLILSHDFPHVFEIRCSISGEIICATSVDGAGTWTPLLAA